LFQLDPENVEALVALAIMDLRTNEGSPFLLSFSYAHTYLLITVSFSLSGHILILYNMKQLVVSGREW